MSEFRMPSLGADMEAAILMRWRVKAGDKIKRGDIIAEVETDKGLIEVEVFEDGVVEQLLVEEGKKIPVGSVLATIRGEGEPAVSVPSASAPAKEAKPPPPAAVTSAEHMRASPLARKTARELGVDLNAIQGRGAGGAIEQEDVLRATGAKGTPAAEGMTASEKLRRAIAAAMARSNREIPHYYLETEIDMTRSLGWLSAQNAQRPLPERLLPAVVLMKAVALALRDVPELNGFWVNNRLEKKEAVHLGFAISLRHGGGLMAPAIHDVQRKTLDELMANLHDLVPRARAGRLRSSELSEATVTVTNLGELGVKAVFGVIYPPQVALVGFGKIISQPRAEGDAVSVRPVLTATLSADHRATDGRRGAQFLEALEGHLQTPEKL